MRVRLERKRASHTVVANQNEAARQNRAGRRYRSTVRIDRADTATAEHAEVVVVRVERAAVRCSWRNSV